MTYTISGLPRAAFEHLIGQPDAILAAHFAVRVTATVDRGFPCRISLTDARAGDTLLLVRHASHDVASPYRSAYAIYVGEAAQDAARFRDTTPPVFEGRALSLRGFDDAGMLQDAVLIGPGEADGAIRAMFEDGDVRYILAFNAAYGCFAARIDRDDG